MNSNISSITIKKILHACNYCMNFYIYYSISFASLFRWNETENNNTVVEIQHFCHADNISRTVYHSFPRSRFLHLFSILPTHFVLLSKWDRFAVTWTVMKAEKSTFKKKWCIRNTDITLSWQERQRYRGCLYLCDGKNSNVSRVTLYVSEVQNSL